MERKSGTHSWKTFIPGPAGTALIGTSCIGVRIVRKSIQAISSLIAERIISPKGLAWIAEGDTELVLWMMETINGHPSAENLIHDLVIRSDQVSVERDLRNLGVAFTGYEIGLPVERFLVDIMRRLVRDGTWRINEPGSRLWLIDGHLYLIWPAAGEEIAAIINQEKIPGLPRTPNSILDMLVDRKLANVREDRADGNRYWVIAPAMCWPRRFPISD
jgi:conjugal transfer pilus assembly protein TraI